MALKKKGQAPRKVRTGKATPVPMPKRITPRAPGSAVPVPMPTRESNYGKARIAKPRPLGAKKSKSSNGEILGKVIKEVGKAAFSPIITAGRVATLPYKAANKAVAPKRIVKRSGNGRMSAK